MKTSTAPSKEFKATKAIILANVQEFKNNFLESYLNWSLAPMLRDVKVVKETLECTKLYLVSLGEEKVVKYFGLNGVLCSESYGVLALRCFNNAKRYEANKFNLTLRYLQEANENFEDKIDNLVEKVLEAGLKTNFLRIEKIKNLGFELEFLITDLQTEVHARTIFVNGEIKAPHYRFITTARKSK